MEPHEARRDTDPEPEEAERLSLLAAGEEPPHDHDPGKRDYVHDDPDDPERGHE